MKLGNLSEESCTIRGDSMIEFHLDQIITSKHGLNKIYAGCHWTQLGDLT